MHTHTYTYGHTHGYIYLHTLFYIYLPKYIESLGFILIIPISVQYSRIHSHFLYFYIEEFIYEEPGYYYP